MPSDSLLRTLEANKNINAAQSRCYSCATAQPRDTRICLLSIVCCGLLSNRNKPKKKKKRRKKKIRIKSTRKLSKTKCPNEPERWSSTRRHCRWRWSDVVVVAATMAICVAITCDDKTNIGAASVKCMIRVLRWFFDDGSNVLWPGRADMIIGPMHFDRSTVRLSIDNRVPECVCLVADSDDRSPIPKTANTPDLSRNNLARNDSMRPQTNRIALRFCHPSRLSIEAN